MTDAEVAAILKRKQDKAIRRAIMGSKNRVEYERGHRARLHFAELVTKE